MKERRRNGERKKHTQSGIEGEIKNKKRKMKQTHGEKREKEREEDRKKENTHLERKRWMRRREK